MYSFGCLLDSLFWCLFLYLFFWLFVRFTFLMSFLMFILLVVCDIDFFDVFSYIYSFCCLLGWLFWCLFLYLFFWLFVRFTFLRYHEPLERTLWFEISKIMPVISLYWFAAQQITSTYRRQKSCSIYWKFSVEWSELTRSFQNPLEVA